MKSEDCHDVIQGHASQVVEKLRRDLDQREAQWLSPWATSGRQATRRVAEKRLERGYRQPFALDADRVMHSRAYTRYIDKTQVFYLVRNDHVTHRVLHVQLVSKIARTIGRFLSLNEDLIEAISLGHDIGHTPFGHEGETYLSALCRQSGIGHFLHNVQSVHFLDRVERGGRGWNLSLQTLDGILCHDGEVHDQALSPERGKTFKDLDRQMRAKIQDPGLNLVPMTLEGCVVRFADTISYIGRDIEDAIRLGIIRRNELPRRCCRLLGDTNGTIVYTLVTDVIENSHEQDRIAFSPAISTALSELKRFNLERIYLNPKIKERSETIRSLFQDLFERYRQDLRQNNQSSPIFNGFLDSKNPAYREHHQEAEIVRDFIAGMTDQYFLHQFSENLRPRPLDL